jgi:hypothetical protein
MELKIIENKKELTNEDVQKALDALEEIRNRPLSKDYFDMMRKNRRALGEIHKSAKKSPWEWSWGLDYFVQFLRFMQEYYKNGENVWGKENKEWDPDRKNEPTRYESLTLALNYYDKWQGLEDEYVKVIYHPEEYETKSNGDGTCTIINDGVEIIYKYGPRNNRRKAMLITYKKLHKAQKKYKKLFFLTVAKYIESWWD